LYTVVSVREAHWNSQLLQDAAETERKRQISREERSYPVGATFWRAFIARCGKAFCTVRIKKADSPMCTTCGHPDDTLDHVLLE